MSLRSKKEKWLMFICAIISTLAVVAIGAAVGSDFWFYAEPTVRGPRPSNNTVDDRFPPFQGEVRFGLFSGVTFLNYGLGTRKTKVKVFCDISKSKCGIQDENANTSFISSTLKDIENEKSRNTSAVLRDINSGLFSFPLWAALLSFAAAAVLTGVVSVGFALLNTFTKPIETINSPRGLYLWNCIPALLSGAAVAVYLAQHFLYLSKNVLNYQDRRKLWSTKGTSRLDYSFYVLLAACPLFLLNLFLVKCSGFQMRIREEEYVSRDMHLEMIY